MAMNIVECLEIVEVEQHYRTVLPAALAGGHCLLQPVRQEAPVGQLRQCVVESQVVDLLFALHPFRNVARDDHDAQRVALAAPYQHTRRIP
jgi:hypothetical protein